MDAARQVTANFEFDTSACTIVVSNTPYARTEPPSGTNLFSKGTLTCSVTNSPVVVGSSTQYVCTGWTGTGSMPSSGSSTNTGSFMLTTNSSIAWKWQTNYWLAVSTGSGGGSLNVTDQWAPAKSNITIIATPFSGNIFLGWLGDTTGCTISTNQITAPMTKPRIITANFGCSIVVLTPPYSRGQPPAGTNACSYGPLTCSITN